MQDFWFLQEYVGEIFDQDYFRFLHTEQTRIPGGASYELLEDLAGTLVGLLVAVQVRIEVAIERRDPLGDVEVELLGHGAQADRLAAAAGADQDEVLFALVGQVVAKPLFDFFQLFRVDHQIVDAFGLVLLQPGARRSLSARGDGGRSFWHAERRRLGGRLLRRRCFVVFKRIEGWSDPTFSGGCWKHTDTLLFQLGRLWKKKSLKWS